MCLSQPFEIKEIEEQNAIIGYRNWRLKLNDKSVLFSEIREYEWHKIEGPHEILDKNSGIYAYNYYYNNDYNYNNYDYYYNNDYYNNNYNYYNYNYNDDYNYNYNNNYIGGIILQYGKIAIHLEGQRSEYAKIKQLFTIRESDAKGPKEFLNWIQSFNNDIIKLSKIYDCETIHWQDFLEIEKENKKK